MSFIGVSLSALRNPAYLRRYFEPMKLTVFRMSGFENSDWRQFPVAAVLAIGMDDCAPPATMMRHIAGAGRTHPGTTVKTQCQRHDDMAVFRDIL